MKKMKKLGLLLSLIFCLQARADGEKYNVYEMVTDYGEINTTNSFIVYGLAQNSTSTLSAKADGDRMRVALLYRYYIFPEENTLQVRLNYGGNDVPAELQLVPVENENATYMVRLVDEGTYLYSAALDRLSTVTKVNDSKGHWKVMMTAEGRYCLKNVATGGYIQSKGSSYFSAPEYKPSTYYLGILYRNTTHRLRIGAAGFTAFVTTRATDFTQTAGLTAYKVTTATKKTVTMETVGRVPSGTGVIVCGDEGEYGLTHIDDLPLFTDNLLQHDSGITGDGGAYFMLDDRASHGTGFYRVADDVTIPANKPFVEIGDVSSTVEFIGMVMEEGTETGITSAPQHPQGHATPHNGPTRNVMGQAVKVPHKGIYIRNGRKVVVN